MWIALINHATDPHVTSSVLDRIAHALEVQLFEDYAPFWQSQGFPVSVRSTLDVLPEDASPLVVFDDADQAGALGWHTYTPNGKIFGRVFVRPILDNGGTLIEGANSISACASHEALEMAGDPYVNSCAFVDDQTLEWQELCDRTEGDSYAREGVAVSNFLGPRAFRDGPGPFDFQNLLTTPWEVRPGGYVERLNIKSGELETTWGHEFPEWKREQKLRGPRRKARLAILKRG